MGKIRKIDLERQKNNPTEGLQLKFDNFTFDAEVHYLESGIKIRVNIKNNEKVLNNPLLVSEVEENIQIKGFGLTEEAEDKLAWQIVKGLTRTIKKTKEVERLRVRLAREVYLEALEQ